MQEYIEKSYRIAKTPEDISELIAYIGDHGTNYEDIYDIITVDTEDTGLNWRKDKVVGWSITVEVGTGWYIPTFVWDKEKQELVDVMYGDKTGVEVSRMIFKKVLKGRKIVGHNYDYDSKMIETTFGVDTLPDLWADTILLVHTVQEEGVGRGGAENFGLKKIAIACQKELGLDVEKAANEEQLELRKSIQDNGGAISKAKYEIYKADLNILGKYAAADTDLTFRVYMLFIEKLIKEGLVQFFFEEEVMPVYKEVTIPMEKAGINVDIPLLEKTKADIIQDMEKQKRVVIDTLLKDEPGQRWVIDSALKAYPPSNKGAWGKAFIERYALSLPKTSKGSYSVSKASLANLEDCWQKEFLQTNNADLVPEKERVRISLALWKEENGGDYFNVQSATQLAEIVFKYYGEPPIKANEETGKESFDSLVIQALAPKYAWVENLRVYRKLQKIKTTYIDRFLDGQEDGKYYFYFKQHGTVSGRYASDAQQLPKPMEDEQDVPLVVHYNRLVRQFLIAGPGRKFVDADFESLEPHTFAFIAGDQGLRDIFKNGWDFYSTIGIKTEKLDQDKKKYPNGVSPDKKSPVFLKKIDPVKRNMAKGYALGVPYGMGGFALGKRLKISTKEGQKLVDGYLDGFPKLREWIDNSRKFVYENGYIKNYLGRIRHLPRVKEIYDAFGENILDWHFRGQLVQTLMESGMEKHQAEKEVLEIYNDFKNGRNNCLNFQNQSLGAGIVNRAALAINRKAKELGIDALVVAQIHDQLVVNCEESRAEEFKPWMEKIMAETVILPGVDLVAPAEVGNNMAETH